MGYQEWDLILMITLIFSKKLGVYKIIRNTVTILLRLLGSKYLRSSFSMIGHWKYVVAFNCLDMTKQEVWFFSFKMFVFLVTYLTLSYLWILGWEKKYLAWKVILPSSYYLIQIIWIKLFWILWITLNYFHINFYTLYNA